MRDAAAVSETGSPAVDSSGFNSGAVIALLWCLIFWEAVAIGVVTLL